MEIRLRKWWSQVPCFHRLARQGWWYGLKYSLREWLWKRISLEEGHCLGGQVYQWGLCQLAVLRGSVCPQTFPDTYRYIFQYILCEMCVPYWLSLPWHVVKIGRNRVPGIITSWVEIPWIFLKFILYSSSPALPPSKSLTIELMWPELTKIRSMIKQGI